ncbi:hypothetical protein FIBSPDRAFT_686824, partial [Athelia psychrophila]
CNNDFTTTFALARHAVSHTGQRAFPCTKSGCDSRFSTDSGRVRHENHLGEKRFTCSKPGCGQLFSNDDDRKRHEMKSKKH